MNVVSGLVVYAIIWFMTLFVILPLRLQSQGEAGSVLRGTHASAPENLRMGRKLAITTGVAAVIWAVVAFVIISGVITIDDIDLFTRFGLGDRDY